MLFYQLNLQVPHQAHSMHRALHQLPPNLYLRGLRYVLLLTLRYVLLRRQLGHLAKRLLGLVVQRLVPLQHCVVHKLAYLLALYR